MKTIGLTGGVGAGKSTVLCYLKEKYDAFVIQADLVGHRVMEPGQSCYEPVIKLFGTDIIKEDKTLDRKKISDIVFCSEEKLKNLNAIIHPAVKHAIIQELEKEKTAGRPLCVVEAALLLEENYQAFCDEIWYVHVSAETRIKRLMSDRGYSRKKSEEIIASQAPEKTFFAHADFVIDNSREQEYTFRQIAERISMYEIM